MKKSSLLILLGLSFFLMRCTNDKTPMEPVDECAEVMASFDADILPILTTNCSSPDNGSCHAAGFGSGDFTSYEGVKEKVDAGVFETRVITVRDMPPSYSMGNTSLAESEIEAIKCWISNGAKND